ncbi:hypothetical protein RS130_07105 [Paraglaciecola aquimarina]|uniref:6-bladed beta-propeller n=1 Tax=Paraglaciecola aquimarina TaxID=1235557 RepID=A0ABU3SUP8_9ALTE|nr:hypothetical protein [Paraglaciecola aquimarina]MDU0353720.1 hypothetical protein [Paraglaciecola aquimarina]
MDLKTLATKVTFTAACWFSLTCSQSFSHDYQVHENWLKPPIGLAHIGDSHGEIAVAKNGEVYVSVMGIKGGIQIFNADGQYLRNVPKAPKDIHGFEIHQDPSGEEFIYGAEMSGKRIFKLTLSGERVLDIDALAAIPKKYHREPVPLKNGWVPPPLRLTAVTVVDNGDMYVVDGYGLDYIHQFSAKGEYITTFGGQGAPWNFKNCHKISIDPRFTPKRILCNDRANMRLVHMKLSGEVIGTYAKDLRRPSAVDFYGDLVAVAEISGRVTLLNKVGRVVKHLGTNEVKTETDKNKTPPEKWREGVFTSPHGISFDANGNLYVTEYNKWGRVLRFDAVTHH